MRSQRNHPGTDHQGRESMKVLSTAVLIATMALSVSDAMAKRGGNRGGGRGGGHQGGVIQQPAAAQKYVLKFQGMHLKGQSTIKLKQELNQQFRGLDLQSKTIEKVVVFAKSKHGNATVSLKVGQDATYPETIQGAPFLFHEDHPITFQRIVIKDDSADVLDPGAWQLKIQGNVKVLKAAVFLKDKPMMMDKIVLNMNDAHYTRSSEIMLKQLVKQTYPHINLRRLDLDKVTIVAKSRAGQGTATLKVGQSYSAPVQLAGGNFQSNAPASYDREVIFNPSFGSGGAWQLLLRGNIKVKKIVLKVDSI